MKTLVKSNRTFFPELPSMIDNLFNREIFDWSLGRMSGNANVPSVNIKETANSYEMEVAAPGLNKNDFKVELDNDMLVISAHKEMKMEDKDENGNYTRKEFSYESFQRSFQLPEDLVIKDKITAKYQDGILHVAVPKSNQAKLNAARVIEIS